MNRKAVNNAGIENIIGSFVVGAPIETAEDVRRTFDFILGLKGMDFPQINVLHLSPGMEFWDDAVKGGYLDEARDWEKSPAALDVFPSLMRKDDLEQMINSFYKEFVVRPGYMLSQLARTIGSRHRLGILKANLDSGTSFSSLGKHLWGGE